LFEKEIIKQVNTIKTQIKETQARVPGAHACNPHYLGKV
jgi:hypothetical protein